MTQAATRLPFDPAALSIRPDLTIDELEYIRGLILMAWGKGLTQSTGERVLLLRLESKLNKIANELAQGNGAAVGPEEKEEERNP